MILSKASIAAVVMFTLVWSISGHAQDNFQTAATEFDTGKTLYETASKETTWRKRRDGYVEALKHFTRSYDLFAHTKTALFIAVINAAIPRKDDAKDYAQKAIDGKPDLTVSEKETADRIITWATAHPSGGEVVGFGGGEPLNGLEPPPGGLSQ